MAGFTSFRSLVRVVAYIRRWLRVIDRKVQFADSRLLAGELQSAEDCIIRADQAFWFANEIKGLREKAHVHKKSPLASFAKTCSMFTNGYNS